jgi:hypothetical protein
MFNEGRENVHDEAQSGRPSLVNDDLVRKVNERVHDDRRSTVFHLSPHFPQISRSLLYDTVGSHLGYWKVYARQVPMMLTEEHKKTACCMCLTFLMGTNGPPPSYRPDLAPSDYHAFLHLKKFLGGKRSDDDNDMKDAVQKWLTLQAAAFYEQGTQKLVPYYDKCLNNGREFVEK